MSSARIRTTSSARTWLCSPTAASWWWGRPSLDIGADLAVARYDGNGALDSTFGGGGTFTTDFHGGFDSGQDVAVQSDGKIVATGTAVNGVALESAMIRMTE